MARTTTAWKVGHGPTGASPPVFGLARSNEQDLADAQAKCQDLLAAARMLAAACDVRCDTPDHGACVLSAVDGELCAVVRQLASLAEQAPAGGGGFDLALRRFRTTCVAALDAVRTCRQTAHPTGNCWFSAIPGRDGCGAVLRIAHRLT